ncbi:MAG TPA: response regulator [Acetobacteraceae bacterium]|nr:response regulator [Acetobacteraceae bacterium]
MPTKPLIAIIDDDESVRTALRSLMRSVGLAARAFASAADFLGSVDGARAACLILDVNMPVMTGLELHRQLVASGRAIPTILITGNPDDAARTQALRNGVVRYLCKPFPEDDLLACVNEALNRSGPAAAKLP